MIVVASSSFFFSMGVFVLLVLGFSFFLAWGSLSSFVCFGCVLVSSVWSLLPVVLGFVFLRHTVASFGLGFFFVLYMCAFFLSSSAYFSLFIFFFFL